MTSYLGILIQNVKNRILEFMWKSSWGNFQNRTINTIHEWITSFFENTLRYHQNMKELGLLVNCIYLRSHCYHWIHYIAYNLILNKKCVRKRKRALSFTTITKYTYALINIGLPSNIKNMQRSWIFCSQPLWYNDSF